MIQGKDIESLVNLLLRRDVVLFHACQFIDFKSYVYLGGIPSRSCLEENQLPFTKFETDEDDHLKDVWNKIFMNFSDFGKTFADGGNGTPNPYGPILLEISPEVLNEAKDIAVCIQPVGSNEYIKSELISLKSVSDIDRIFVYPVGNCNSTWVKYKDKLRKEFNCSNPCDPDISCTVLKGSLPLKYVKRILVDPYNIYGKSLRDQVATNFPHKSGDLIQERFSKRNFLYNELANLILYENISSIQDLSYNLCVSKELSTWAKAIEMRNLGYQFKRFANYLYEGTLLKTAR